MNISKPQVQDACRDTYITKLKYTNYTVITKTKFTISHCMVYFLDPVKIYLRKPFTQTR